MAFPYLAPNASLSAKNLQFLPQNVLQAHSWRRGARLRVGSPGFQPWLCCMILGKCLPPPHVPGFSVPPIKAGLGLMSLQVLPSLSLTFWYCTGFGFRQLQCWMNPRPRLGQFPSQGFTPLHKSLYPPKDAFPLQNSVPCSPNKNQTFFA